MVTSLLCTTNMFWPAQTQNSCKNYNKIFNSINCPIGPNRPKSQILSHKKSPGQDFITRTLSRPEPLYNFNYHNEVVAECKICLASPIRLFSQFNLFRFVWPLDQIDLAFFPKVMPLCKLSYDGNGLVLNWNCDVIKITQQLRFLKCPQSREHCFYGLIKRQ